jgi:hypothetical protein
MAKGTIVSCYSDPNKIEIVMHCGIFYSGSISFLLLKQRLHRKRCISCQKQPIIYDKKNLIEYYENQSVQRTHVFSDLDRNNLEYKNKQREIYIRNKRS